MYPFITTKILQNGILFKIPITAKFRFHRYSFIPFPTCANDNPLILDTISTELLVDPNKFSFIETNKDTLQSCLSHFDVTVCYSYQLDVIHHSQSCLASLLLNTDPSLCNLQDFKGFFQSYNIADHVIVFNGLKKEFTLSCASTLTQVISSCNIIVQPSCSLRNADVGITVPSSQYNHSIRLLF